jgi:hypothetical protein
MEIAFMMIVFSIVLTHVPTLLICTPSSAAVEIEAVKMVQAKVAWPIRPEPCLLVRANLMKYQKGCTLFIYQQGCPFLMTTYT